MSDAATLTIVISGMLGFLGFVYQNIVKTKLKTRYLRLFIRRKNWLIHDSVEDCLDSSANKKILNSYFYRVNFIDYYVKKFVPFALSLGFVAILYISLTSDKLLDFKIPAKDSITEVSFKDNGVTKQLESGQMLFQGNDGKFYNVDIGKGQVLSFSDKQILTVSSTMVVLSCSVIVTLLLLASYFLNHTSSEEFLGRLKEDIEHLEKEMKLVDELINEASEKHSDEYKADRLAALADKRNYIHGLLNNLKTTKQELNSLY